MSKGSLFWANASGKLGESVFYRSGGEQRNRTYVRHIKNPKTEGQMRNRIQLSNWVAMYRRLKPILEKTFTSKKASESGFNAFVSANKSRLRYAITPEMLDSCDYIPVGARVSSGTIVCNIEPQGILAKNVATPNEPARAYTRLLTFNATNVEFPSGTEVISGLTGGQIYSLLTANGNPMQLPSEFKVITLYGSIDVDDVSGEWAEGGMPLSYTIYTCSATNADQGIFVGNEMFKNYSQLRALATTLVSEGADQPSVVTATGLMLGGALTAEDMQSDCVGMIIYYEGSNGKNANNAFIYAYPGAVDYAKDFSEGGDVFAEILANSGFNASGALTNSSQVRLADFDPYEVEMEETPDNGDIPEEDP